MGVPETIKKLRGEYAPSELVLSPALQMRTKYPHDTVVEYGKLMREGVRFPPVSAVRINGVLHVTDGFCRVEGAHREEKSRIAVEFYDGSMEDAIRDACGANATHGLSRSQADKHRAVLVALEHWGHLSDRAVAAIARVSHTYVSNLRAMHASNMAAADSEIEEQEIEEQEIEEQEAEEQPETQEAVASGNVASAAEPEALVVQPASGGKAKKKGASKGKASGVSKSPLEGVPKEVTTAVGRLVRALEKYELFVPVREELGALDAAIKTACGVGDD